MSNGAASPRQQRRASTGSRNEVLRLEGLIIEKRLTRVETTRYLVIDFNNSSISVYKKPPPKDEGSVMHKRNRSMPKKLMSSVTGSLGRASSAGIEGGGGLRSQMTCENLAHMSRRQRHFAGGAWDPKFTVSSAVDWKIRDVENDETLFYLILPADWKNKDSEAEVFSLSRVGKKVSYRSLKDPSLSSIKEDKEALGGAGVYSNGGGNTNANNGDEDENDFASVSSTSTGKTKSSIFSKSPLKRGTSEQEVIYQFRVMLDGNEKFIWLQAAAELGRLCSDTAISLASGAVDVTKKLFVIPLALGSGRSHKTALRYAEWARLIDQKKNVSKFQFDVHDIDHIKDAQDEDDMEDSGRYNSTRLVKVIPTYAYRNRRMTEKDLYKEMTTTSEKWEDFRGQPVGDREEEVIGSLHAEVLACHGLPKLDKLSSTDAVCYLVCGPYAFATDVIDGFLSPVWPSKSRRACIFPLFQAYQKCYVGVFDDDGPGAHDDFAGRVVIDVARLRPNCVYDVFLPLRQYQNTFVKKPRGVIHLRLRVEWDNEKKALMSYMKLPKKTKQLGNAVTLNCADLKAFRNVVLTVQGKDVPGRYKQLVQKGLQREMKLYKTVMKTGMQEQMRDIVLYMNPYTSLCIFFAWMHCVYSKSLAYVPVYFVAGIIALLLKNYNLYGVNEDFNFGFTPVTISETIKVLVKGGQGTKYIKPIRVATKNSCANANKGTSNDELDGEEEELMAQSVFSGGSCFTMDGDHMEFPFSEAGRYPKKTLSDACVDASAIFNEDDDGDEKSSGKFASLTRKAKKGSKILIPKANREDDEEEDEDEFGLMVKSSIPNKNGSPQEATDGQGQSSAQDDEGVEHRRRSSNIGDTDHATAGDAPIDATWKRVSDPRGLPEQDASVQVKSRKTLKEEFLHNKDLLHKMSMRLFDDRMFIVNEEDPGHSTGEELALHQAIGTNKYKSPIVAKIAEYFAPGLEGLKVGLSVWRVGFNIFTWRDPFLTSLFLFGLILVLCVLVVFPWRLLFFVMGVGAVGPQNWVLRKAGVIPKKKKKKPAQAQKSDNKSKKIKTAVKKASGPSAYFQFHNHLTTNLGIDVRSEKSIKSSNSVHRAVVPNSPLISRRFYDWPPNPSLSSVDIYSEE